MSLPWKIADQSQALIVIIMWSSHTDANGDAGDDDDEEDFDFNDDDVVLDLKSLLDNVINAYTCTPMFKMENTTDAGSCIPIYLRNGHLP